MNDSNVCMCGSEEENKAIWQTLLGNMVKGKWALTIILTARGLKFFKIMKVVNVNRKNKQKQRHTSTDVRQWCLWETGRLGVHKRKAERGGNG